MFDLFGIGTEVDSKYTTKVNIPQYLPKADAPTSVYPLYDDRKYKELLQEIHSSNVSEEQKNFLRLAAARHIVFNYSKIADYYAHSDKEMQELMEKSALVIIDFNDAIANGYVKLSKNIEKIMQETGRPVKEEFYNQTTGKKDD